MYKGTKLLFIPFILLVCLLFSFQSFADSVLDSETRARIDFLLEKSSYFSGFLRYGTDSLVKRSDSVSPDGMESAYAETGEKYYLAKAEFQDYQTFLSRISDLYSPELMAQLQKSHFHGQFFEVNGLLYVSGGSGGDLTLRGERSWSVRSWNDSEIVLDVVIPETDDPDGELVPIIYQTVLRQYGGVWKIAYEESTGMVPVLDNPDTADSLFGLAWCLLLASGILIPLAVLKKR